jgi:hypothetical protein
MLLHTFPWDKKTPPRSGGVPEANVINAGSAIIPAMKKGSDPLPSSYFLT